MAQTVPAPANIFNLKVVSASCSVSWGGQGGTLQLSLVEDPLLGSADFPELGTACSFTFGAFYFAGIFQRQTYSESLSGRTYDVVLESPAKILDGVQVIIDSFDGLGGALPTPYQISTNVSPTTGQVGLTVAEANRIYPQYFAPKGTLAPSHTNIFNVFGSYENYDLTSYQGYYGLADVNSVGMPLSKLLPRLQLLSLGTANSNFDAKIKYGATEYSIDLSEVIARMPNYLRIAGPVQNVNSILAECAEFAQFDYFVSIQERGGGRPSASGPISSAELIVHVLDKQFNPSTGVIEGFVNTTKAAGTLISGSYGTELADATTQKVIVGGPASRYHVVGFNDTIPVWGKLANGRLLTGRANADFSGPGPVFPQQEAATSAVVFNNSQPMDSNTFLSGASSGIPISENMHEPVSYIASLGEIRAALGGMEVWATYKSLETLFGLEVNGYTNPTDTNVFTAPPWIGTIEANKDWLTLLSGNKLIPMDLAATSAISSARAYEKYLKDKNQRIFNAVSKAASEFYMRQFLVPLPFEGGGIRNNRKFISEEFTYVNSWEIADSAQWTYAKPFNDVTFYDGAGRLKSVCTWPSTTSADWSVLGSDYAIALDTGHVATTKGGPAGEIFWYLNPGPPFANDFRGYNGLGNPIGGPQYIPFVLFDCGAQVPFFDGLTTPDFGLTMVVNYLIGLYIHPSQYISTGKQGVQFGFPPDCLRPSFFGVPQQSPRYNYGPWYKFINDRGRADVSFEEGLVPENYANFNDFNNAGFALVDTGSSNVTSSESGNVEVATIPQYNIAEKFAGSGPYVTNMDISIGTDGVKTSYKFNTWTPNFGKLARYNIDRLQRVNKAMIAYLQRNRQQITKRPFPKIPFEKTEFPTTEGKPQEKRFSKGRQDMGLINMTFKSLQ